MSIKPVTPDNFFHRNSGLLNTALDFTVMTWGNNLDLITGTGANDFKELCFYHDFITTFAFFGVRIIKNSGNQVAYGIASPDGVTGAQSNYVNIGTATWVHVSLTYNHTTHVFKFYVNGVAQTPFTVNINSTTFLSATPSLTNVVGLTVASERYIEYQAELSAGDILAQYQSHSLTPVRSANLFTNTPIINNTDFDDLSGNGHDWSYDQVDGLVSNYFPGPFDSVRCENLTCSEFCKDLSCPPSILHSGIYYLQPGKTNDTIYDADRSTEDVAIPNPFIITAMVGD